LSDEKDLSKKKFNIECTRQTIKNYLNDPKLKCFIKTKKLLLTEKDKEKRRNLAQKYLSYSFFDRRKVIWSDVCKLALLNTNRREFYWKRKADPLNEDHIKKTLKFGGGSLLLWGCITSEDVGELVRINGIMNLDKYINILSDGLLRTMENFGLDTERAIFMQDNDPKHVSKKTRE
jgi:hypothetical protein